MFQPEVDRLADPLAESAAKNAPEVKNKRELQVKAQVMPLLMQRIDISVASALGPEELRIQIAEIVEEIIVDLKIQLNASELKSIVRLLVDDMVGLGPLEPLLKEEAVTDIMVNGPRQVYVERKGKVELTDVQFRDDAHVLHVATRIVTEVGRRVDESTPLVDARLKDGSRVNIIIPPLAIDGPTISIRKFSKKEITLDVMARQHNISADMATVLKIAGRARLNILISGGTGSGKTTLLNAMSRMIDHGERTVTIEDAAELQLQQPHVVRLETRPANIEGEGEITMRHLVKNALRMRPDRIILGEIRGEEAIDMLQAMNTGHDGSMGTIHSNTPRDALTRLENMVAMSGFKLPAEAVREQIQSAIHLIIQISRQRDGKRRITQVTEITGMEGEVVTTQDLFKFIYEGETSDGSVAGRFDCSNLRPHFMPRAEYFGLGAAADGGDGVSLDLIIVGAIFVGSVALVIGLSLFVLTVVLRMQHKHRKRLARVGRRRMSGRLDIEDARSMLVRQKQESNLVVKLTEALARVIPLLDTTRLRANFRRAALEWSVGTFVAVSLGVGGVFAVLLMLAAGKPIYMTLLPGLLSGMFAVDRFVKFRGGRRANRFMKQLPDALDTIIRGIRSGLPVIECIGGVGPGIRRSGRAATSVRSASGSCWARRWTARSGGLPGSSTSRRWTSSPSASPSRWRPAAACRRLSAISPTSCAPASG